MAKGSDGRLIPNSPVSWPAEKLAPLTVTGPGHRLTSETRRVAGGQASRRTPKSTVGGSKLRQPSTTSARSGTSPTGAAGLETSKRSEPLAGPRRAASNSTAIDTPPPGGTEIAVKVSSGREKDEEVPAEKRGEAKTHSSSPRFHRVVTSAARAPSGTEAKKSEGGVASHSHGSRIRALPTRITGSTGSSPSFDSNRRVPIACPSSVATNRTSTGTGGSPGSSEISPAHCTENPSPLTEAPCTRSGPPSRVPALRTITRR